MLSDVDLPILALRISALAPEDAQRLDDAVRELRAERAAAERERIAKLRAMSDGQVIMEFIRIAQPDDEEILGILRDAGFVRHAGLEAAYRAGFEAFTEGWNGEHPGDATASVHFAQRMEADLDAIRDEKREAL